MTRRVVLTGPECSGKTTLAAALARRFRAPWLPEAARGYAESVERELIEPDADIIARASIAAEETALAASPPLIILDTDLISTVVYTRHYYGRTPGWIEAEARARRGDIYLLCAPDLPWTADGVRDRPTRREELYLLFDRTLAEFECTVAEVAGAGNVRERVALAATSALAAAGHAW